MTAIDYLVLIATIVGIAAYGVWRTRRNESLNTYLKGDSSVGWGTVGLSVMATQASAVTFLSTPGQGYESGIAFVQNYFGMPLALIVVAAVFLPIYRRLNVFTAYEYLGSRFDGKTRLLGAALFLLQRGLAAGITIYAPAIIVSTVLGWRLDLTILFSGILVVLYTVTGGSRAVSITQRYQMTVILIGMAAAFVVLLIRMPDGLGVNEMLKLAGSMGKLDAVDYSLDFEKRYTIWSGLLGGFFLSLSYFGTDQSQVQRYLSGRSMRAGKLGLMFNAVVKIPMQFLILLMGALVFVFFQFEKPPIFFNQSAWQTYEQGVHADEFLALDAEFTAAHSSRQEAIDAWLVAHREGTLSEVEEQQILAAQQDVDDVRARAKETMLAIDPRAKTGDADFVFITFILNYLPHGLIGLLIAVIFCAALSSTSSELSALGSTTAVDIYKHVFNKNASEAHYLRASKVLTGVWGIVAVGFALFANLVENLIEAVNILGSIFYGVILGIFLVAFFLKRVTGTAVFTAGVISQALVILFFFTLPIGYLWYNLIGCAGCVLLSLLIDILLKTNRRDGNAISV